MSAVPGAGRSSRQGPAPGLAAFHNPFGRSRGSAPCPSSARNKIKAWFLTALTPPPLLEGLGGLCGTPGCLMRGDRGLVGAPPPHRAFPFLPPLSWGAFLPYQPHPHLVTLPFAPFPLHPPLPPPCASILRGGAGAAPLGSSTP